MKKFSSLILIILLAILSCEKETSESKKNYELSGVAQKGPFRSGTNITLLELKNTLQPTGLTFYSTVSDSMGSYQLPEVELRSNYVELMADGYYYNENQGHNTSENLLLKAVADVSDNSEININILTHISAERIKYLVQEEGKTYTEAKAQSQDEILKIFNMEMNDPEDFEKLDISKEGELNGKLLAISSIIQGNRSVHALAEALTDIGSDIKMDGVIDSEELQTRLATSATLCDVATIRANLADYYNNNPGFNNFQDYVKYFVEQTEFESLIDLNFPETTPEGKNLLALPDQTLLDTESTYCLSQNIDISNLPSAAIAFTIVKKPGPGAVISTPTMELTGWTYNANYCTSGNWCGIKLTTALHPLASDTPITITFKGSSELVLTIYVESESLPDNGGSYVIRKFMKW